MRAGRRECERFAKRFEALKNPTQTSQGFDDFNYIDQDWLERLVFEYDELKEEGYNQDSGDAFKLDASDRRCDIIIILGEADILGPEVVKDPFIRTPRIPKQGEIFKMENMSNAQQGEYRWKFAGRFSPRPFNSTSAGPTPNGGSAPEHSQPPLSDFTLFYPHMQQQQNASGGSSASSLMENPRKRKRPNSLLGKSENGNEMSLGEVNVVEYPYSPFQSLCEDKFNAKE